MVFPGQFTVFDLTDSKDLIQKTIPSFKGFESKHEGFEFSQSKDLFMNFVGYA